jgi:glutathione peroxidase-family protein
MKSIKITGLAFLFVTVVWNASIYDYSVPKIEGGNQPLSSCQGKKILIITLPVQHNASADSLLYSLDTLGFAHRHRLRIIAVPAYEDGFTPAQQQQLKQWYRSKLGNYIVITNGLYTRKTSGAQQHPLFRWLTKIMQNENFDIDVMGAGQMFFVSKSGELYGVLRPPRRVGSLVVQKTLRMQQ